MAVREVAIVDMGKIAAAVAAILALLWTGVKVGHDYLGKGEKIVAVEAEVHQHVASSAEQHESFTKVLNRLATVATAKEIRATAEQKQCRRLIAKGLVDAEQCDPGPDEEARASTRGAP